MKLRCVVVIGLCCWGLPAAAAELRPETARAFDEYIRRTEARLDKQVHGGRGFLWVEGSPERLRKVRGGQVLTEPWAGGGQMAVEHGLIHDWIGAVFVPGVTLDQTLTLMRDYDNHKNYYQPEVMDSKILSRDGNHFHVYMRLLKKKVLTVVLNTQHDVEYFRLDRARWYSRSRSIHVAEVQGSGKPGERELPVGDGHGFVWRLNSYWRFQESGGGVFIECQVVSLSRGVPPPLVWLIDPIVRNLPRESLSNTLRATRSTLLR